MSSCTGVAAHLHACTNNIVPNTYGGKAKLIKLERDMVQCEKEGAWIACKVNALPDWFPRIKILLDCLAVYNNEATHESAWLGFRSVTILEGTKYYFALPRPPEEIGDIFGMHQPWRFCSLQEVGWGPPVEQREKSTLIKLGKLKLAFICLVGLLPIYFQVRFRSATTIKPNRESIVI
jgi:hypothetical protein